MRSLLAGVFLIVAAGSAAYAADDAATCKARRADLASQAANFQGETLTKRLIQADLDRATRELLEGDAEECAEALDHAARLLSGKI